MKALTRVKLRITNIIKNYYNSVWRAVGGKVINDDPYHRAYPYHHDDRDAADLYPCLSGDQ